MESCSRHVYLETLFPACLFSLCQSADLRYFQPPFNPTASFRIWIIFTPPKDYSCLLFPFLRQSFPLLWWRHASVCCKPSLKISSVGLEKEHFIISLVPTLQSGPKTLDQISFLSLCKHFVNIAFSYTFNEKEVFHILLCYIKKSIWENVKLIYNCNCSC